MAQSRSTIRKWRKFAAMEHRRRALLIEAALWLAAARVALLTIPFPKLAGYLGTFVPPTHQSVLAQQTPSSHQHEQLAADIGWAVTRAANNVPFKAVCLPQAIAARAMLKRRGVASALHFGAAKISEKPFDAHAWLYAAGVEVTGFPVAHDFVEIACFV